MAIQATPVTSNRPPWDCIQPVRAFATPITTSATNTATSAAQVTGLTLTPPTMGSLVQYVRVNLTGDSVSNSGANNVIITLWLGTVGTGTQLASTSATAQSGALAPLDVHWMIPATSTYGLAPGSSYTFNIGMHGSGAGTNTMTAASTSPILYSVEYL